MKCPIDQTDLAISDRQGVEIDYCPKCRGVWLDRGELDKIIERSEQLQGGNGRDNDRGYDERRDDRRDDRRYSDDQHGPHKKKRRESFLGDLFEF